MISTVTSIIIAPPEGNLTVYLESLKRLQSFHARLLLPSHGAPSARPAVTLADAIAHRMKRQEELLAALTEGPWTIPELAVQLYRGLPPALVHFAKLQLLAGLEKLQREGLVKGAEKTQWSRIDCRQ